VLEVCLTSNVATGVFPSYVDHPLGALRDAGVRITLASDDPPYFGATIGGEYAVAHERFGLDEGELVGITRLAVQASFAESAVKASISGRLDSKGDRPSI
jgi:adenosine deaminase